MIRQDGGSPSVLPAFFQKEETGFICDNGKFTNFSEMMLEVSADG